MYSCRSTRCGIYYCCCCYDAFRVKSELHNCFCPFYFPNAREYITKMISQSHLLPEKCIYSRSIEKRRRRTYRCVPARCILSAPLEWMRKCAVRLRPQPTFSVRLLVARKKNLRHFLVLSGLFPSSAATDVSSRVENDSQRRFVSKSV